MADPGAAQLCVKDAESVGGVGAVNFTQLSWVKFGLKQVWQHHFPLSWEGAGAVLTPRGSQEDVLERRIPALSQPNSLTLLPARSVSKPLNANDQVIKQLAEFTWAILSLDNHLAGILSMLIFIWQSQPAGAGTVQPS